MGENIKITRNARLDVSGNGSWPPTFTPAPKSACWWKSAAARPRRWPRGIQAAGEGHHAANRRRFPAGGFPRSSPPEVIAKEREIAAQSDRLKGKPAAAMEKILAGVLDKFFQTYCLVDQGFVKRNSEVSVKEHVAQIAKQLGDEITIRRFVRFQVGEPAA
jgi:hypothetical protein